MSRYLTVPLAALVIASAIGCEKSKLREDMMGDSTWESSAGEEKWEAADQPPRRNDKWEEENAPMEGAPPAEEQKPESSLDQPYPRVSTCVISRDELRPVRDGGLGRFLQNVEAGLLATGRLRGLSHREPVPWGAGLCIARPSPRRYGDAHQWQAHRATRAGRRCLGKSSNRFESGGRI